MKYIEHILSAVAGLAGSNSLGLRLDSLACGVGGSNRNIAIIASLPRPREERKLLENKPSYLGLMAYRNPVRFSAMGS